MWNHATDMRASAGSGRNWPPKLTSAEAADLFAYLYSVLYFAPPGEARRGQRLFESKCAACHKGGPGFGAGLSAWKSVTDPVMWAERMWNHSAEMDRASARKDVHLPELSTQDVADLLIYFRSVPALRAKSSTFRMGEPEQGLLVFERSCEACHSFGPAPGKKIDLLGRRAPSTVAGYIADMWNHAALMRGTNGQSPQLEGADMSNLIAFLFSQSYFFQRGDPSRGRMVFENNHCAGCHDGRRKDTGAPDLTQASELYSPITLTAAVWSHGPAMFQEMRKKGISWPQFHGSAMADLIAYLNSRLTPRVAALQNTNYPSGLWEIRVGPDDQIRWFGPSDGQIYVRVDDGPPQLFASGPNGTTNASFMTLGHLYVFILLDGQGTEIARAVKDLR
jgi:cytochrome c